MRNSTYRLDDNHLFMIKSNILWLQVFYHNTAFGDYFTSLEETLDSHTPQKFSILGTINDNFRVKNKFEFLLEIPGKRGYNRWRQYINPISTTKETNEITNKYEPVKLSWNLAFNGGLSKSFRDDLAFFDCSAGTNELWWYPIGARHCFSIPNTIPLIAYDYEGTEIALWIRYPSLTIDGFIASPCFCRRRNVSVAHFIILLLFS